MRDLKYLLFFLLLIVCATAKGQTPVNAVPVTTNSQYYEPPTGRFPVYRGSTYGWTWPLMWKDSTYYVTPTYLSQHYVPTTRQILNGYGILGGTQLNVDITKSVDTTSNGLLPKLNLYPLGNVIWLKKADTASISNRIDQKISLSEKGIANGVSTLDGGGKVPLSQLPANLFVYQGLWNPNTNTPTLVDGTGTTGYTYEVSEDGIHDWGARIDTLFQGDMVIYDGSKWQASRGTNRVVQVNGYQGIVDLNTDDIGEGTTNKYYTDARVAAYGDAHYYPLGNPSGYLTTETDPTVPAYAKSLSAFSVIQTSTDALYPSKTGSGASGTWAINISGNAATVTNGIYSTGSYANPSWITSLDNSKITGLGSYATRSSGLAELTGATFSGDIISTGGTFSDGTQGFKIGAYVGGAGYGALYAYGVTPGTANYSLASNGSSTNLNATTEVILAISDTRILSTTSTGVSVTGNVSATSLTGAGTGLTGTAAALNIGGNAATASTLTGILSPTLGGSGVNNSGTLTWGAGGTLGSNAYNSTAFLTANQLISFTPTGDVTGSTSGTTALVPVLTIGAGKVTNTMLAGGIDLATKVTGVLPSANSSVSLLASFYTLTGNSGTTPTDIYSYTIPANTLSADGDFIDGSYTLAVGVQASTIDNIEINFAGQTVANFGPFSHANASDGIITIVLKRISSSDAQCSATWLDNGGSVNTGSVDFDLRQISSVNFTTTNVLKVIATGGSTNSIAFYDGYYRLNK